MATTVGLLFLALAGHAAICIALVNRAHGAITSRLLLRAFDAAWYLFALGVGGAIVYAVWNGWRFTLDTASSAMLHGLGLSYLVIAILAVMLAIAHRCAYLFQTRATPRLASNHTRQVSLVDQLQHRPVGDLTTAMISSFPGNEIFDLHIHDKQILLPDLDQRLVGFSITHLSDLHITGQLTKPFYHEVVEQANALGGDLIVITGDIVEKQNCLPWVPEILGRLRAPAGVYYVLGNHEQRIADEAAVREAFHQGGLIGLGGRHTLLEVSDCKILLAGTEMPWYRPAPDVSQIDPQHAAKVGLRILLSHTPDQLEFARRFGFDLMLAGHTHGGQIRFPMFGPILSPSIHGIRHASGLFYVAPTLLHVSRGIAGTRPLRWNCPPELSKLVLCRTRRDSTSSL